MTLEEFRRLADAWGGDIERWPETTRAAARHLAATAEAAQILEHARSLDALLAQRPPVTRKRALRVAHAVTIAIAAENGRQGSASARWHWPAWLVPAASIACSALIGVSLALLMDAGDHDVTLLGMILDSGSMATGWILQ